ncbi:MAG: VirB4 family type IV secretion system protein [Vulcanimicrobiaceae bacterium]
MTTSEDEFLTVFRFYARDVGMMADGEVFEVARRLSATLGALKPKPRVKVSFYAVRQPVREYLRSSVPAHPVLEACDEERERFFLEEAPVFETVRFLAFAWKPADEDRARLRAALLSGDVDAAIAAQQETLSEFEAMVARLKTSLDDAFECVARLGEYTQDGVRRSELLEFLHYFVIGRFAPFNVPEDSSIALNGILASRGGRGRVTYPKIGDDYVLPILLKTFPKETEPLILDELTKVGVSHFFAIRYLPMTLAEVKKETRDIVKDFQGEAKAFTGFVDPGAIDASEEVTDAHGAAKDAYTQFGACTFTVVLRAKTLADLHAAKNALLVVLERAGFPNAYVPELAAWDAIVATFPGASRYVGVHKHLEHALALATLVPLHEHDRGRRWNGSRFRAPQTPPHFYALAPGSQLTRVHTSVEDVEHGFGLAPSSWGKSTFQAFLAMQRLGRLPYSGVTMLDKGLGSASSCASYRAAMMADGSVFEPRGEAGAPGFALFDRIQEPAAAEEVLKILTEMLVLWGVKPTPDEDEALRNALRVLAASTFPPEYRSMTAFVRQLQDDTHRLREVFAKYTDRGALGSLLDCSQDAFATSRFTVFDLEHVLGMDPRYLVPVLRVLFLKTKWGAEAIRETLDVGSWYQHHINVDEAHLLQATSAGQAFIRDILKTGRGRNLSVFLWSNGLEEMASSAGSTELLTQARTRIYGGDPSANDGEKLALFRSLGLNDRALAWLPKLEPREFILHQPDAGICQRLNARLSPAILGLIGDPRTNAVVDVFREDFPVDRFGLHEWKIRLLEREGQHVFAARLREKIVTGRAHETPRAVLSLASQEASA